MDYDEEWEIWPKTKTVQQSNCAGTEQICNVMLDKATILCRYRLLVDKVSSVLLPRSTLYTGKIAKHFYLNI